MALWKKPVCVRFGAGARERRITTPAQARHLLLIEWPLQRTPVHKAASEACLAAMQGRGTAPARIAFIEAAIEAGIFVE